LPPNYVKRMEEVIGTTTTDEFFTYCAEAQLTLMDPEGKHIKSFEELTALLLAGSNLSKF
jgi:hypothetical protein